MTPAKAGSAHRAGLSLFVLGAGSVATQLVLLREIMSAFGGNELAAGLALGIWLLLLGAGSGLGALAARRGRPFRWLAAGHLILALLPPLQLAAVRSLPLLTIRGQMLGLPAALLGSFAIFLPFGLVAGGMIPLAARWLGGSVSREDAGARRAYIVDTAGSAAGGLLFSLLLVHLLSHGWTLAILGWLHLSAAFLITAGRARLAWALPAAALLASNPLDRATLVWRFPGQEVLLHRNTPYGQLTLTRLGAQLTAYQDGLPLFSTGDREAEARVHPVLSQRPAGASLLLIGGGISGDVIEAIRHAPARLDCVELDPAVCDLGRRIGSIPDLPQVHLDAGDGRLFLKRRPAAYDAILVVLPGPETAQLNRYYTLEFFREVHSALRPDGVLGFTLPSSPNYLGEEELALSRSIYQALRGAFHFVAVLPGERQHFLASDRAIDLDIAAVLGARGITTVRLLDYDWPTLIDPFRREELNRLLSAPAAPNRDLSPQAFSHRLDLWVRRSEGRSLLIPILAAASFLAALATTRGSPARVAVATSGFATMASELTLLLLFQVLLGYLYLQMALFVTVFLVGAALGALVSPRIPASARAQVGACDAALLLLALAMAGAGTWGVSTSDPATVDRIARGLLALLLFLIAGASGCQFAAAARLLRETTLPGAERQGPGPARGAGLTGGLYLADLAGAASGTIVAGLILLPKAGVAGVTTAVIAIKAASLAWQLVRRSPRGPQGGVGAHAASGERA